MSQARRNIMLGTAGHVDHGKSALVKLLTGCETDTLAEEKQRGLTIDLGFAPCQLADKKVVGIVDVPGHVDFIRNMVAGAHGIDVVIFVVAADDGIMPQTHEHLHILTLMGLRHGLVALTKIDIVDAARREFVTRDVRRLLAGTFLANAPICPISTITGEGFEPFYDALNAAVDACGERACAGPFRMWVEDSFSIRGAGTVVTGIPTHGRIRPEDSLFMMPGAQPGHVRKMQVYGEDAPLGSAGECVALNIPELDQASVKRGMALVGTNQLEPVSMAEAELRILPSIEKSIPDYLEVQFHTGTAAVLAHIALLENVEITGGQSQLVQLRLATPLPLVPGERFVVRASLAGTGVAGLTTIGGGQIIGLSNTRLRRKKQWTLDLLAARRAAVNDPLRWCEQMVRESESPATAATLAKQCWSRPEEITAALNQLQAEGLILSSPNGGWLHRDTVNAKHAPLLEVVEKFHTANAQRAGLSREELLAALPWHPELLDTVVARLLETKKLERNGPLLARAGWSTRLPDRDQQLYDKLAAMLQQGACAPPLLEEIATALKEPGPRVANIARLLAERGEIVRLDERIWMHRDAVEIGKQAALKLFQARPMFTTMEFRDAIGVSRKYAVPLIDYLDKARFTVRYGNNRAPGVEAKKRMPQ